MIKARRQVTDRSRARAYHVVSRCVRREHPLGHDRRTGRDFSRRRAWLTERMLHLGALFAVELHAFAVLGNHFHLVPQEDPQASLEGDAALVARRHVAAFPPRTPEGEVDEPRIDESVELLLGSPIRLARARRLLGTMSSYMKHLKQPIARRANREESCTVHFFEQRFWSGMLEGHDDVAAAMCYVDLNPVRTGLAAIPEQWEHASVSLRGRLGTAPEESLRPLASGLDAGGEGLDLDITFAEYSVRLASLAAGDPAR